MFDMNPADDEPVDKTVWELYEADKLIGQQNVKIEELEKAVAILANALRWQVSTVYDSQRMCDSEDAVNANPTAAAALKAAKEKA